MIDDEAAEKAVDYLRDSAVEYGRRRGRMESTREMLKVTKAIHQIEHADSDETVSMKEAAALASPQYRQAIEDSSNAAADYETMKALREAADAKFQFWRTYTSAKKQGVI